MAGSKFKVDANGSDFGEDQTCLAHADVEAGEVDRKIGLRGHVIHARMCLIHSSAS